jgi:hypothetical protein
VISRLLLLAVAAALVAVATTLAAILPRLVLQ